jgi:hypothetical protein
MKPRLLLIKSHRCSSATSFTTMFTLRDPRTNPARLGSIPLVYLDLGDKDSEGAFVSGQKVEHQGPIRGDPPRGHAIR